MSSTETPVVRDAPVFRDAREEDLPAIIAMLADDKLGQNREDPSAAAMAGYRTAFEEIEASPDNRLVVMELASAGSGARVIGFLQFTYLPSITYGGRPRAMVEAVRVADDLTGRGFGTRLFEWAFAEAALRGCHMIQLTTNKARPDALRFYERLGFTASHEGMKRAV